MMSFLYMFYFKSHTKNSSFYLDISSSKYDRIVGVSRVLLRCILSYIADF